MSCVKSARSADMQRDSSKRSAHGGRNAIATETENPADSERKRSEAGTPSAEKIESLRSSVGFRFDTTSLRSWQRRYSNCRIGVMT